MWVETVLFRCPMSKPRQRLARTWTKFSTIWWGRLGNPSPRPRISHLALNVSGVVKSPMIPRERTGRQKRKRSVVSFYRTIDIVTTSRCSDVVLRDLAWRLHVTVMLRDAYTFPWRDVTWPLHVTVMWCYVTPSRYSDVVLPWHLHVTVTWCYVTLWSSHFTTSYLHVPSLVKHFLIALFSPTSQENHVLKESRSSWTQSLISQKLNPPILEVLLMCSRISASASNVFIAREPELGLVLFIR